MSYVTLCESSTSQFSFWTYEEEISPVTYDCCEDELTTPKSDQDRTTSIMVMAQQMKWSK